MALTSTKSCGTAVSEAFSGTTDAWSTPSNATASDNAYAVAAVGTAADISEYLKCTNFGFAIPTAATIVGVEALVEWKTGVNGSNKENQARLVKAGTVSSSTTFDATTSITGVSDTTKTFGSASSLWGETLTPADVNDSGFGFALSVQYRQGPSSSMSVDHVQIRITYQITVGIVAEREYPLPMTLTTSGADVELFGGIAFTAGSSSADLSDRLQTVSVRRGRPFNLDRVSAGTAQARFTNLDGELDPSNASGAWYGSILPLRDISFYRRIDDVTYWLHRGRVERYLPEWAPPDVQFLQVEAADAFERLATEIIESDQATLTTALAGANNDLVFTAVQAGATGDAITITYVVAGTSTALTVNTDDPFAASALVEGELPAWFVSRQSSPWSASPTGPSVPVSITVSGSDIVVNVATNGGGSATSTASEVKAAMEANSDISKLVTVALAGADTGAGVVTAMAKTNLSGGTWAAETSGERIDRVLDLVGWPAGYRDIDTGIYTVCPRGFGSNDNVSALSHILDVAESELGYVFVTGDGVITFHDGQHRATATRSTTVQATFSDDGTGIPYMGIQQSLDKDRIANEVTVTAGLSTSIPQTVSDATSQATYGRRTLSRSTQLNDDADALTVAQAILDSYKDPAVRFEEITVVRTNDTSNWDDSVLGREIGDLVAVRTNPPAHDTTIAYEAFVEEIAIEKTVGQPWRASFRLTAAAESTTPGGGGGDGEALLDSTGADFVLDSGTLG